MSSFHEKRPLGVSAGRGTSGPKGLIIAIAAPCGSAMTLKRPTVGMSVGGTQAFAPSDFAFSVSASTSSAIT